MNSTNNSAPIPVGFRFHPTDEELVGYYLHGKVGRAQRDQLIQELDLYKIEPWDLHEVCRIGDDAAETQSDWYFFSHKDKKYPTGNRANRATTAGFWKATGRDKPIHTQRHVIGMRKTLVFYKGRAPHGQKTDWIMHEFRLDEGPGVVPNYESDGWVVCRVFRKTKNFKTSKSQDDTSCSFEEDQHQQQQQLQQLPELLSPPVVSNIFNGNSHELQQHPSSYNNFHCKQELSIDDYGTHHHVDTSTFLSGQQVDQATTHQLQANIHHHHLDHMAATHHHHLAPCSSSTFRELCNRPFDPPTSNDARSSVEAAGSCSPFPDQSTYWMQLSEGTKTSTGTRRDQTLADITCHVGRMKRQATDLVHLWNV